MPVSKLIYKLPSFRLWQAVEYKWRVFFGFNQPASRSIFRWKEVLVSKKTIRWIRHTDMVLAGIHSLERYSARIFVFSDRWILVSPEW